MSETPNPSDQQFEPKRSIRTYDDRLRGPIFGRDEFTGPLAPIAIGARLIKIGDPGRVLNLFHQGLMSTLPALGWAMAHLQRGHAFAQLGDEVASAAERRRVRIGKFSGSPLVRAFYSRAMADRLRRGALRRRAESPKAALQLAKEASKWYLHAHDSAVSTNARLALRCSLFSIYSDGLAANIEGETQSVNLGLLMRAVQCAALLVEVTPRGEPKPTFAATIIADLARPVGLAPTDLPDLCGTQAHAAACQTLFGARQPQSWSAYLLREVESVASYGLLERARSATRALILAGDLAIRAGRIAEARQVQTWMLSLEMAHSAYRDTRAVAGRHVQGLPGLADWLNRLRAFTGQPNSNRVFR